MHIIYIITKYSYMESTQHYTDTTTEDWHDATEVVGISAHTFTKIALAAQQK
jgi:hypothetical protein